MVVAAVERRRATLVSADAAGYSRLMAVDELATIKAIKIFREAAEEIAADHGGRGR
jgi:class 3 adenylate cyclase